MSRNKLLIYLLVGAGLAGLSFWAVQFTDRNPVPKAASGPISVEAAQATQVQLQDVASAVGTLRANQSVVLKAELAGKISKIHFKDGARVTKGEVLFEFDSAIQQAQLQQARAERDLAQAKLQRTQELFDKKFLSAAALDDAKAGASIAQARLELAQATLDKMLVRAPFAGAIGIRQVDVGDVVREGAELVNLEDLSAMKVDFRLPERLLGRVQPGQVVNLRTDAFIQDEFPARVLALDSAVETSGRSLLVRAALTDVSRRLKPGMFMRVDLVLELKPNALVVPEESIVTQRGEAIVYRVIENKAVRTPVQTGLRTLHQGKAVVEVVSGLAIEDLVITAGQLKIRADKTPVRVVGASATESNKSP